MRWPSRATSCAAQAPQTRRAATARSVGEALRGAQLHAAACKPHTLGGPTSPSRPSLQKRGLRPGMHMLACCNLQVASGCGQASMHGSPAHPRPPAPCMQQQGPHTWPWHSVQVNSRPVVTFILALAGAAAVHRRRCWGDAGAPDALGWLPAHAAEAELKSCRTCCCWRCGRPQAMLWGRQVCSLAGGSQHTQLGLSQGHSASALAGAAAVHMLLHSLQDRSGCRSGRRACSMLWLVLEPLCSLLATSPRSTLSLARSGPADSTQT